MSDPKTLAIIAPFLSLVGARKVYISREGVTAFNSRWPCSTLRDSRAYWFEFDAAGDLIDTDCPESDDGPAASALADDCKAWMQAHVAPRYLVRLQDVRGQLIRERIYTSRGAAQRACDRNRHAGGFASLTQI